MDMSSINQFLAAKDEDSWYLRAQQSDDGITVNARKVGWLEKRIIKFLKFLHNIGLRKSDEYNLKKIISLMADPERISLLEGKNLNNLQKLVTKFDTKREKNEKIGQVDIIFTSKFPQKASTPPSENKSPTTPTSVSKPKKTPIPTPKIDQKLREETPTILSPVQKPAEKPPAETPPASPSVEFTTIPIDAHAASANAAKIQATQEKLQTHGIDIPCRGFEEYEKKNCFFRENISKAISNYKENQKELLKRMYDAAVVLTYKDLYGSLSSCTEQLSTLLGDSEYAVGHIKGKSQEWIAGIALPRMKNAPIRDFQLAASGSFGSSSVHDITSQSDLSKETVSNFVIFDDASYSGMQITESIMGLSNNLRKKDPNKIFDLYIVLPFLSKQAQERIEQLKPKNLRIHVLTSDIKIPSMTDVFSEEELQYLSQIHCISTYANEVSARQWVFNKCLAIMEWKIPDAASIPRTLTTLQTGYDAAKRELTYETLATEYPPPYARPVET